MLIHFYVTLYKVLVYSAHKKTKNNILTMESFWSNKSSVAFKIYNKFI